MWKIGISGVPFQKEIRSSQNSILCRCQGLHLSLGSIFPDRFLDSLNKRNLNPFLLQVFFHFVGCNSQSEDLANFMTRYIDEMTEFFMGWLNSNIVRDKF